MQTFTTENEHSVLSQAEYANSVAALSTWAYTGEKPTPRSVAATCPFHDAKYGTGCFYDTGYQPAAYATKVYPRPGGRHWPALTAAKEQEWSERDDVGIEP